MEEEIPTINAESFDNYKYTPLGRMLIGKDKRKLNGKDSFKIEIIEDKPHDSDSQSFEESLIGVSQNAKNP